MLLLGFLYSVGIKLVHVVCGVSRLLIFILNFLILLLLSILLILQLGYVLVLFFEGTLYDISVNFVRDLSLV